MSLSCGGIIRMRVLAAHDSNPPVHGILNFEGLQRYIFCITVLDV